MYPITESAKNSSSDIARKKSWLHHLLLLLSLATAVATQLTSVETVRELHPLLLLLATAASISAVASRLPLQSVLFAACITAFIGSAAHGLSARTGIPLGPLSLGESIGPRLFNTVPWSIGLLWVFAIFNSRGVARLILRPWRQIQNYGFWVIGLTAILAVVFDLALEPFAKNNHFWFWQPTKIQINWQGASPLSFLSWAFVTLLVLAFITPFLIRKQPGEHRGPDFAPLALWLGAIVLFAVNSVKAGQWTAVTMDGIFVVSVACFSWRGAKW